jgi:hypothetical protein
MTADGSDLWSDVYPDEYAKDDCACGHPRYTHAPGTGCARTVSQRVPPSDLPEPVYEDTDPFSPPTNWPPYSSWPTSETPCPCRGFSEPETEGWS